MSKDEWQDNDGKDSQESFSAGDSAHARRKSD